MKSLPSIPVSLLAFLFAALLYVLQLIPFIGVFLMLLGAPFWTGLLVTLGMLGIAIEVLFARFFFSGPHSARIWLLIPLAYFGWYECGAYSHHTTLQTLRAAFDTANAAISIPFDPEQHALTFVEDGIQTKILTQDYGLPVAFMKNENITGGYLSKRLIDKEMCAKVDKEHRDDATFINTSGIDESAGVGRFRLDPRFCMLQMPARPDKQIVTVARSETETAIAGLPVRLIRIVIRMPDGRQFVLRAGSAAPYKWFPMPLIGCGLDSYAGRWVCFNGFSRDGFAPLVSSKIRYDSDVQVLATALGLKATAPNQRRAADRAVVEDGLQQAVARQLERDIADVRNAATEPDSPLTIHSTRVLAHSPDALLAMAPTIVAGIKHAAQITDNPARFRGTGKTLAQLFGQLPEDVQAKYAGDMTILYKQADEANDGRHWLYEVELYLKFPKAKPPEAILADEILVTGRRSR